MTGYQPGSSTGLEKGWSLSDFLYYLKGDEKYLREDKGLQRKGARNGRLEFGSLHPFRKLGLAASEENRDELNWN